jgi:hypothetical protein
MPSIVLRGLVLLTALACSDAPSALRADLGRATDDVDVTCADLKTEPVRWGVVILGSEKDLETAERKAREISEKTGVPFTTDGYSIDPRTRQPVYGRAHEGEYLARGSQCGVGTDCITVERSSAYARFTPTCSSSLAQCSPRALRSLSRRTARSYPTPT